MCAEVTPAVPGTWGTCGTTQIYHRDCQQVPQSAALLAGLCVMNEKLLSPLLPLGGVGERGYSGYTWLVHNIFNKN